MLNEPSTFGTPTQNGVLSTQVNVSNVNQNHITGPASYTNEVSAVKTSMNNTLTVKCNTTSSTTHGLSFNGAQALTSIHDNVMQTHTYGISLTNTATIGQQGNSTTPTNNRWLGTWTGTSKKTMNYDQYSSAQNSKMYVTWGGALDPNSSSTVIATPGAMAQDDYFHGAAGNPANTLLNASSVSPSCRIAGGGGGGGGARLMASDNEDLGPKLSLLEVLVKDTSLSAGITPATRYIGRNMVYRQLKGIIDPSANNKLNTFYSAAQLGCFEKFYAIEDDLQNGNYTSAQLQLAALSATNTVESNYHNFYNLYLHSKIANFNSNDSTALVTLSNKCPYIDGGVVYQARAFYNMMYNTYVTFKDNCSQSNTSRLFETVMSEQKEIKVELRTKLYPNPSTGDFNISVIGLRDNKQIEVIVVDILGKSVYKDVKLTSNGMINLKPALLNGIYLLKVILPDGSLDSHKLIIEK